MLAVRSCGARSGKDIRSHIAGVDGGPTFRTFGEEFEVPDGVAVAPDTCGDAVPAPKDGHFGIQQFLDEGFHPDVRGAPEPLLDMSIVRPSSVLDEEALQLGGLTPIARARMHWLILVIGVGELLLTQKHVACAPQ